MCKIVIPTEALNRTGLVNCYGVPGDSIVQAKYRVTIQLIAIALLVVSVKLWFVANWPLFIKPTVSYPLWALFANALWFVQMVLGAIAFFYGLDSVTLFALANYHATEPEETSPVLRIEKGVWWKWILLLALPAMLTFFSFGILSALAQVSMLIVTHVAGVLGQRVLDVN